VGPTREREVADGWTAVAGGLRVMGEKVGRLRVQPVKRKREFIVFETNF
jgi:hypothetical protein